MTDLGSAWRVARLRPAGSTPVPADVQTCAIRRAQVCPIGRHGDDAPDRFARVHWLCLKAVPGCAESALKVGRS